MRGSSIELDEDDSSVAIGITRSVATCSTAAAVSFGAPFGSDVLAGAVAAVALAAGAPPCVSFSSITLLPPTNRRNALLERQLLRERAVAVVEVERDGVPHLLRLDDEMINRRRTLIKLDRFLDENGRILRRFGEHVAGLQERAACFRRLERSEREHHALVLFWIRGRDDDGVIAGR